MNEFFYFPTAENVLVKYKNNNYNNDKTKQKHD